MSKTYEITGFRETATGEVARRRVRSTGTHVILNDNGPDASDGRWETVCEEHGGCVSHSTRTLAMEWMSHPEDWCPTCRGDEV